MAEFVRPSAMRPSTSRSREVSTLNGPSSPVRLTRRATMLGSTPGTGSGSPAPRARPIAQRHEGLGRATDGSRGWGAQLLGTDRALAVVSVRCPGLTVRLFQAPLLFLRLS